MNAKTGGDSETAAEGPKRKPGDEAAPGIPGSGEDICPKCGGTGRLDDKPCPNCAGTGIVQEGIGGA